MAERFRNVPGVGCVPPCDIKLLPRASLSLQIVMVITPTVLSPTCILCRGAGMIDYQAFIDLFEELRRLYGPLDGVRLYVDLHGCDSTLDFKEELRIVDYIHDHLALFRGSKWAFVADSLLIFGLGRMGQILTSDFPFTCSVFQSPEQAAAWLGCPEIPEPVATDQINSGE